MALATLALTFCGNDKKPTGPETPVTTEPAAPPVTTPTPQPPLSASCARMQPGATKYSCRDAGSTMQTEVNEAIARLQASQPRIFDGDQVKDVGAYIVGLVRELDKANICGDWDGEELVTARSNNLSEQYDVLTATSRVRRFFVGTCYPSLIPLAHPGGHVPPPTGCSLPSSKELSCGDPPSRFVFNDTATTEKLQKDKPELFDFSDKSQQGWPRVKDWNAYYTAIIASFTADGFCGRFDGEEIAIKKTNDFTEHFDVNYSDKYVRMGPGVYRGACYPAAF